MLPALEAVREPAIGRLQFDAPLPDEVLAAAAGALERHPEVALRAFGDGGVDPSLAWLSRFPRLQRLSVELFDVTDFAPIGRLHDLVRLHLGATRSVRPSLDVVAQLPRLRELSFDGQGAKGFDAVGRLAGLERLGLRAPKMKSLDALAGHASLREVWMSFGGLRDLTPLATIPRLDDLSLLQVRGLDDHDLAALPALRSLSLHALRQVTGLRFLEDAGLAATVETLTLDRLGPIPDLRPLASCTKLRELRIVDARPEDRDLSPLHGLPDLRRVFLGNPYPAEQLLHLREALGPGVVNHQGNIIS